MRIIAGEARGRRIITPTGRETRPTSDKVKESLFNILGSRVPDSILLDLYAGSGNIGLEAISRGAQYCIFIDNSRDAIKTIRENIDLLKYENYCEVYNNNALSALRILRKKDTKFDIIFLDPPYHKNIIPEAIAEIVETGVLSPDGIIVSEHDVKDALSDTISGLTKFRSVTYGNTAISFYKQMEE